MSSKDQSTETSLIPLESVEQRILSIRKQRVMLDADLAALYGVKTKVLNQAVKRNSERFPEDFMFQLSSDEKTELVTNCDRFAMLKHSSSLPYAFSEHGAIMVASVLNTPRAVQRIKKLYSRWLYFDECFIDAASHFDLKEMEFLWEMGADIDSTTRSRVIAATWRESES